MVLQAAEVRMTNSLYIYVSRRTYPALVVMNGNGS
jgi:hypothetical protein